jgi:hypothetical protein
MERFNVYISSPQKERLQQESEKNDISMAELIRRMIDDYFNK